MLSHLSWSIFLSAPCSSDRSSPALPAQTTLPLISPAPSSHRNAADRQIIRHLGLPRNTRVTFHHPCNKTPTLCLRLLTAWLPPTSSLTSPLLLSCPLGCKHSVPCILFLFLLKGFSVPSYKPGEGCFMVCPNKNHMPEVTVVG